MKKLLNLIVLVLMIAPTVSQAQTESDAVIKVLTTLVDQYDKLFVTNGKSAITLVYVPGSDDPFGKVFSKYAGKKLKDGNTVMAGGFKQLGPPDKSHLQGGITSQYGKDCYRIILDLDSKVETLLNLKGRSIIILEPGKKAVVKDFGENRKEFLDAVNPYFSE